MSQNKLTLEYLIINRIKMRDNYIFRVPKYINQFYSTLFAFHFTKTDLHWVMHACNKENRSSTFR